MRAKMVTDERFFEVTKYLLHRVADLETQIFAIAFVLKENFATDFLETVLRVERQLEARPESKDLRETIDTLELTEILDAFSKYKGVVQ
jgi:hypothetical protein